MSDVHTPQQRSFNMSKIRSKDTKPELLIRRVLHRQGFRFRLNVKGLAGKPDIVLPKYKAVIFVNGCFWHYHDCSLFQMPMTRNVWWRNKLEKTRVKDSENIKSLLKDGWRVMVVWECSFRKKRKIQHDQVEKVISKISDWLNSIEEYKEIIGDNGDR